MSSSTAASSKVVWDQRERVGDWAIERIAHVTNWGERYQTIGLEREGELVAAVVFNLYSGADIAAHTAGRMSRAFLRACFGYAFLQLKCRRITGYIAGSNAQAQTFVRRLGFQYEGILRNGLPADNILIFGLLLEECRFL